jgi:hypothetical protein
MINHTPISKKLRLLHADGDVVDVQTKRRYDRHCVRHDRDDQLCCCVIVSFL